MSLPQRLARENQFAWNDDNFSHDITQNTSFTVYTGALEIASVAAVPIPAAAWLFGSALMGLMGISRRRKS